ncbi:tRNA-His guanylyltransferase [Bonamia ostreae]|uniref:tRNA-His guanylyltransferase n=1 Tax=Bonamia ostreae TaxID=126728 RepID=A0ABV2AFD6_9EUKA
MFEKSSKCVLEWWKTCFILFSASILSIWTNFWVPLFLFPFSLWIIGLFIATSQQNEYNKKYPHEITPSERARLLEEKNSLTQNLNWKKTQIVVLQGRNFPENFKKPFDQRIPNSLSRATADTLESFRASTAYTYGQKVYLLFPPHDDPPRRLKICKTVTEAVSAISSFLTIRFFDHLQKMQFGAEEKELKSDVFEHFSAYFAGTVVSVDTKKEALNYFMNANLKECLGYGLRKLALLHFIPSEIFGLTNNQIIRKLKLKRKVQWSDQPNNIKYGVFVKLTEKRDTIYDEKSEQNRMDEKSVDNDEQSNVVVKSEEIIENEKMGMPEQIYINEETFERKNRNRSKLSLLTRVLNFNHENIDFLYSRELKERFAEN